MTQKRIAELEKWNLELQKAVELSREQCAQNNSVMSETQKVVDAYASEIVARQGPLFYEQFMTRRC